MVVNLEAQNFRIVLMQSSLYINLKDLHSRLLLLIYGMVHMNKKKCRVTLL